MWKPKCKGAKVVKRKSGWLWNVELVIKFIFFQKITGIMKREWKVFRQQLWYISVSCMWALTEKYIYIYIYIYCKHILFKKKTDKDLELSFFYYFFIFTILKENTKRKLNDKFLCIYIYIYIYISIVRVYVCECVRVVSTKTLWN